MAANQVIINGQTVLDLRSDTVTADKLLTGYTAHDKSGTKITGTAADSDAVIREAINSSYSGSGSTLRTITLTNLVADEGRGWISWGAAFNCTRQGSSATPGDGATGSCRIVPSAAGECTITFTKKTPALVSSHKYYVSFKVKYESAANCSFDFYWPIAEPVAARLTVNAEADVWTRTSAVFTRESFTDGTYQCRFDYNNEAESVPVRYTSLMLFDLTEAFGVGCEPSKEWLNEHITTFGDSLTVHYVDDLEGLFSDIANAIRAKEGSSNEIYACDFANRIRNL